MQLSVVVPVYNGAKFLSRCLDTLQQQTFTDFQVIFVDDGSTDESPKILDLFAAQDNRVLVIHKKNAGVSAARNDGINHAIGTYIHFMDVDDVLDEHYYEYMLNNAKNADVVCSGFVSNSKYSADLVYKKSHVLTTLFGKLFWSQALIKSFVWRYLFKTEFIKNNNLRFDTNLISQEDAIFVLQSFVVANKLVVVPNVNYHYLFNENSALNKKTPEHRAKLKQQYKIGKNFKRQYVAQNHVAFLWWFRKIIKWFM